MCVQVAGYGCYMRSAGRGGRACAAVGCGVFAMAGVSGSGFSGASGNFALGAIGTLIDKVVFKEDHILLGANYSLHLIKIGFAFGLAAIGLCLTFFSLVTAARFAALLVELIEFCALRVGDIQSVERIESAGSVCGFACRSAVFSTGCGGASCGLASVLGEASLHSALCGGLILSHGREG